jgi:hypothetical protein
MVGWVQARILGRQEDIDRLISRAEADGSCLGETTRFNHETRLACRCQRRSVNIALRFWQINLLFAKCAVSGWLRRRPRFAFLLRTRRRRVGCTVLSGSTCGRDSAGFSLRDLSGVAVLLGFSVSVDAIRNTHYATTAFCLLVAQGCGGVPVKHSGGLCS